MWTIFEVFYWICYNGASVLRFVFLAMGCVGSYPPDQGVCGSSSPVHWKLKSHSLNCGENPGLCLWSTRRWCPYAGEASFPSYGNRVEECFSNLSLTPKSFGYLVEPEGKSPIRHIQQGRLLLCPKPPRCVTLGGSTPQSLCEWALCSHPLWNPHGLYAVKTWLHLFYIWRPLF